MFFLEVKVLFVKKTAKYVSLNATLGYYMASLAFEIPTIKKTKEVNSEEKPFLALRMAWFVM